MSTEVEALQRALEAMLAHHDSIASGRCPHIEPYRALVPPDVTHEHIPLRHGDLDSWCGICGKTLAE